MPPKTMFQKIWDAHVVHQEPGAPALIYIDLHLVHEVTSPQAFEGLRLAGRSVRRPDLTVATVDHNTPTWELSRPVVDTISKRQLDALSDNIKGTDIAFYDRYSRNQGIVHVIGPDLGYTQPGMTVVCGDSHTSTHGALGCFALGIGTSEVEHVLATQTLRQFKPKTMEVRVDGPLPTGVEAKDLILGIIGQIGINGGIGHVIEYTGEAVRSLSMDGRMTVCNMSIEGGARAGMIAPDDTTFDYVRGRLFAPKGEEFEAAVDRWRKLPSDHGAVYDKQVIIDAAALEPFVTWGTNPGMVAKITDRVPDPASFQQAAEREAAERALSYMALEPDTPIQDIPIDRVFIGACTNSRIEDLRAAADVIKGKKGQRRRLRHGSPRLCPGEGPGGGGGLGPHLRRRGLRLAHRGMLHVPRHEPGRPPTRRAVRLHLQPQLREPPGQRRADAPGQPAHGRSRRDSRSLRGYSGMGDNLNQPLLRSVPA